MTELPRITIWHPAGPEAEVLADLIRGVIPDADVHLGQGPALLRVPLRPDPELAHHIEGDERTIRRYKAACEAALRPPSSDQSWLEVTESRRERRMRLGLHWWQREAR